MRFIWYIHVLRFLVLFISLIAFICHVSQCLLLNAYREKTGIPDWLTAGHWQYLTWYISLCLSLAGSSAICLNATWFKRPTRYFLDKCIGSLVILPILASIITATLFESIEPWTDGHVKVERSGLLNSCYLLDSNRDKFYPMLYQRCMLSDTTWICAIFLCINWAILVGFVMFVTKKCNGKSTSSTVAVAKNTIRPAAEEPKWGRYIPDPPSSIYSATTLGNRSGLLTPSSTLTRDKHSEFYYNCAYNRESMPSLPPSSSYREYSSDYLLKGGDYLSTKSSDFYDNYTTSNSKSSSAYYYGERSPSSSYYYKYSSERHHGSGGKRGGGERRGEETYDNDHTDNDDEDEEEEQHVDYEEERQDDRYSYRHNSSRPLRVNTAYHSPSSYSADKELESATTVTTTPLYSKFSSKSPTFDLLSDRKYNTYY
ncbi:unnamed protein product [Mucor circinelloides]